MKRNLRIALGCLNPIRKRGYISMTNKYMRKLGRSIKLMQDKGLFENNFEEPKIGDIVTFDLPKREGK